MARKISGLVKMLGKFPLVASIRQLKEVEENCAEIVEEIDRKFAQMPRAQTCVDSEVPNERTFCNYFQKCCIGYCNRCENFENKYLGKVA